MKWVKMFNARDEYGGPINWQLEELPEIRIASFVATQGGFAYSILFVRDDRLEISDEIGRYSQVRDAKKIGEKIARFVEREKAWARGDIAV